MSDYIYVNGQKYFSSKDSFDMLDDSDDLLADFDQAADDAGLTKVLKYIKRLDD